MGTYTMGVDNKQLAAEAKKRGNDAFGKKRHKEAIEAYSEAIQLDPCDHVFFANRAAAHLGIKQYQEARDDARRALQIEPSFLKASFRLATALKSLSNGKEACQILRGALKHCKTDKETQQLQQLLKECSTAAAEEAEAEFQGMSPALRQKELGNRSFKDGKFDEAIPYYTRAIEMLEQDGDIEVAATVYNNRAACHQQQGSHAEVIRDCSHCLESQPKNVKALIRRGLAYQSCEKWVKALDDMTTAVRLDPSAKVAADARNRLQRYVKEMAQEY